MAAAGRGSAFAVAGLLLALTCLHEAAYGAIHTVGGSQGWDLGVDYTSWAAGEKFKVGDVLFFPYTQTVHNVVVVNKAGYDACSDSNAITTLTAGNDNVTLTSAGTHYYLCSVVGHCSGGMKLAVTVSAAAAAAPTPTASAPAPAPTKTPPSSAPAPTPINTEPSAAPASMESLASAPAPAPAVSTAPPSGPTPATSPTAPGLTPTTPAGTPTPPSPSPPNAAPSLSTAAAIIPLALILASLLAI